MALRISSSESTLGSDGPWYTFAIQVGSPQQTIFVLPSTSLRQFMLVAAVGCQEDAAFYGIDDPDCVNKRGGLWDLTNSTSYLPDTSETYAFQYSVESVLNTSVTSKSQYGASVQPGQDTVKFGFEGSDTTPLQQQYLAGHAATNPYLGLLPLSPYNGTIASLSDTHYSVLGALNASGSLPSRSWAYNAGAPYRNAVGSLTLGGYDSNRGNVENVMTTYMNPRTDRELELAITSIQLYTNSQPNSPTVGGLPATALIDSTVPEIWLPTESCMAFEDAFGIIWDSDTEMYLVDDDLHTSLVTQNASVTLTLAPNTSTSTTVDIRLPYASFNLTAAYPLAGINDSTATKRYFPLKRASDVSQIFLGRTFFQEAYVSANYDTATFNVSQATFVQDRENLVTMYPYQIINQPSSGRISAGAIAGIVVGVLALFAIIAGLGWWLWRRRREGRSIRSWARNVPGSSVGATSTTIDVSQEQERRESHEEFYKPVVPVVDAPIDPVTEEPTKFKRTELDATTTVRPRHISYDRAELPAGSVRRASDQSRASRPSISPLDPRANSGRFGHFSIGSGYSSPPSGYGAESPPLHDGYSSGVFELHGHSRGPSDTSVKTLTELDGQQEHQQQQHIVEAGGQTPRDGRGILQGRWGESSTLEHHVEHDEDALTVTEKDPLVADEQGGDAPGADDWHPATGDPEKQ